MLMPDEATPDETWSGAASWPLAESGVSGHLNSHNGRAAVVLEPDDHGTYPHEWTDTTAGRSPSPIALRNGHVATVPHAMRYLGWRRHAKRGCDIVASTIAMIVLFPIGLFISVAIILTSLGNPFFVQRRIGQQGRTFPCIKFRTMYPDAESRLQRDKDLYAQYIRNDYKLLAHDDPRVFAIGGFLRRTSLDELPQLINVLLGHMSLVGPRPVVPPELDRYGPWRAAYLTARPGITGAWQVNGRSHVHYPERAQLDAQYVEQWRFRTDLMIILKTIPSVVRRHGSH